METPIGNIPGDFEQVELSCPRCNNTQVIVGANENGYFEIKEGDIFWGLLLPNTVTGMRHHWFHLNHLAELDPSAV